MGKLLYGSALPALRTSLRRRLGARAPRVWARHSFVSPDSFVPFVSDLDLTLWFDSAPDFHEISQAVHARSNLARLMPWLGEVNLYVAPEAREFAVFANPLELDRDPETRRHLPGARSATDAAERAVFILRGIESDIANLLECPEVRVPKWRSHLAAVGLNLEGAPDFARLTELAIELSNWGNPHERSAAARSLVDYFNLRAEGVHFPDIGTDYYRWIFLPYRFCFKPEEPPTLEGPAAAVARAQLSWELWGLLGQLRNALFWAPDSREGIAIHLETLERFTKSALMPEMARVGDQALLPALERLSSLYRKLREQAASTRL